MLNFISERYLVYRSSAWFWLLLVIAAGAAAILPISIMGVPEGYDILDHLLFASAYRDAILRGDLTVGWAAADNFGFGSIGTRFYPPLADFLTGLTNIFTDSWYDSFIVTAFFWMILGCVGVYFWAREYMPRPTAAVAAVMFAVMPYHVFQIYQFTLVSEFAAAAVLPFCFWFLTRIINHGKAHDVLLFAISSSVLVLTHLPTVITGSLALCVYALFLIDRSRAGRIVLLLLASACLTLLLTAFYWVRLVSELGLVMHNDSEAVSGSQAFAYHLFPIYFTARPEFYNQRMLWMIDNITILTILIMLPAAVCLLLKLNRLVAEQRQRKFLVALSVTGLLLIFFVSFPSKLIWEYAPVLHKIQFPWRFLSPASIIASLLFAMSAPILYTQFPRFRRITAYAMILLLSGIAIYDVAENILSSAPYSRKLFAQNYGRMHDRKSCECWWPVGASDYAFDEHELVRADGRTAEIVSWEPESRNLTIAAGAAGPARIATFWYPYWKAEIDGSEVQVGKDENGAILVPVPSERSDVRLYFSEPTLLRAAKYLSEVSWIGMALALVFGLRRSRDMQFRSQTAHSPNSEKASFPDR